ncbi:hypothetical protein HK26_13665 [Acetobacter okinawensis]|uniref:Uncharacterized protein n=1 Tax=Acetobacter okinawensis TaxID=1076594 RepID=A0A252BVF8_9PROT|nr:hypothetical protein HK26_13665 [Acetobacter okinawensis]
MVFNAFIAQGRETIRLGSLCLLLQSEAAFALAQCRRQGKKQVTKSSRLTAADVTDRRILKSPDIEGHGFFGCFSGIGAGVGVAQDKLLQSVRQHKNGRFLLGATRLPDDLTGQFFPRFEGLPFGGIGCLRFLSHNLRFQRYRALESEEGCQFLA